MAIAERLDARKVRYRCPPAFSYCVCQPSRPNGQRDLVALTIGGVKVTSTEGWASFGGHVAGGTAQDLLPNSPPGLRQGRDGMRGGNTTCSSELTYLQISLAGG